MQIDALILRARESSSKIFYETQVDIRRLDEFKKTSSANWDNVRLGIMVCTLPLSLFLFFRILFNIRTILTDREKKSRNLEEAKQAIEKIVDSIPVGMAIVNEQREILRVNPEALRIFDVSPGESVLGERCEKMFCLSAYDSCPFVKTELGTYENEVGVKTASGREITVLKKATYIHLSGERVILEAFMDISERIEMEKRLKSQQDYTNAVLQGVQAGVVVIAAETHTIVDMNETAARLIGVDRDAAIGSICHEYICPAEIGKCPVTDLGRAVDHTVRKLSNGKSILKSVVPFKRGDDTYLLENFVDITEQVQTEEQLKEALNAADAGSRAKSEFLSRMSHEFRTPLNAIMGFSDMLLTDEQEPLSEASRTHVEYIAESGRHLLQMITDVLEFSISGNIDFEGGNGKGDIFSVFERGGASGDSNGSPIDADGTENTHTVLLIDANTKNIEEMRRLCSNCAGCTLIVRKTVEKGMRALQLLNPETVILGKELGGDFPEDAIEAIQTLDVLKRIPFVVVLGNEVVQGADGNISVPVDADGLRKVLMKSKEK